MTADLFLVHGGLWDTMDAEHFWRTPGIVAGLESSGLSAGRYVWLRYPTMGEAQSSHPAGRVGQPVNLRSECAGSRGSR
jgi:hypothetical protein